MLFNFFTVTREKSVDLAKKQSSRTVYQCHVFGAKNAGKSALCAGHIGGTVNVSILNQNKRIFFLIGMIIVS